jgi:hypothetical protein
LGLGMSLKAVQSCFYLSHQILMDIFHINYVPMKEVNGSYFDMVPCPNAYKNFQ